MKKILIAAITVLFSCIVSHSQTIDSSKYSTIKVYSKNMGNADPIKVYIGNQEPFIVKGMEVTSFKVYSTNSVIIQSTNSSGVISYDNKFFQTLEPGTTYYFIAQFYDNYQLLRGPVSYGEIRSTFGKLDLENIEIEEDLNHPIKGGTKPYLTGTGFLISTNGTVVTNSHVVEKSKKITIRGIGGDFSKKYPLKLISDDKSNDIALLKIDDPSVKFDSIPYQVRSTGVETGEPIFVLGYPLTQSMGEEIKLTDGIVSSKTGYQGSASSYQVSASAQPGNSGSPLFDKNGNLIGIINARIGQAESVTYGIKIAYLNSMLESNDIKNEMLKPASTTTLSLVDLVKKYSGYVFIIETEK
jgi:S1-C subfamily serine protease